MKRRFVLDAWAVLALCTEPGVYGDTRAGGGKAFANSIVTLGTNVFTIARSLIQ
jgi:hypothetical protein